jgi:sugar phosphate isomerase/epimerase
MLNVGIRAHDFGKLPAVELATRIAAQGLTSVQLVLNKAIAGLDLQPGELSPGLAFQVGNAFRRAGVQIAVLGCYINPLHPDPATRAVLLGWFKEHLRHARDFGCGIVALESGSLNADYSFHPDNHGEQAFQQCLASLTELVQEAERFGVCVGIEGVTSHVLSTPGKMRRMLDAIPSPNLQVVFDPANLLSVENHHRQEEIIRESCQALGARIAVVHAKDYVMEASGMRTVPAGRGQLNYPAVLGWLAKHKPMVNILLEEANESTAAACMRHLREITPHP